MKIEENIDTKAHLTATYYCDHEHPSVVALAKTLSHGATDQLDMVQNCFTFVRDEIIFGGDLWCMKASSTLKKGYGACYNKNLLLIALLRSCGIGAILCANPLKRSFNRYLMGKAYVFMSEPFYHCFSIVFLEERQLALDPTLDSVTYNNFFVPENVSWNINWQNGRDMLLYTESIMGSPKVYVNLDQALDQHLDSHFMFKHEPTCLLKTWLKIGNNGIWKKTGHGPVEQSGNHEPNSAFQQKKTLPENGSRTLAIIEDRR